MLTEPQSGRGMWVACPGRQSVPMNLLPLSQWQRYPRKRPRMCIGFTQSCSAAIRHQRTASIASNTLTASTHKKNQAALANPRWQLDDTCWWLPLRFCLFEYLAEVSTQSYVTSWIIPVCQNLCDSFKRDAVDSNVSSQTLLRPRKDALLLIRHGQLCDTGRRRVGISDGSSTHNLKRCCAIGQCGFKPISLALLYY
jgi:hypothetical protein